MGKSRPGQQFAPSARDWNRFVDVANAFDAGQLVANAPSLTPPMRARNSTGSDVARLAPMAINDIVFDATDNQEDFDAAGFVVDSTATPSVPTGLGKFVIAAAPIKDGEIGPVWMSGVCPALVEVGATWHRYCDIKASAAELKTYPAGGAEILWQESGTGTGKRAIIRFGPMPFVSAQFDIDTAMATTDSTEGADLNNCTIPGYDGNNVTLYNHDESGGNYIFEGDAGDKGTCWYSLAEDKWYISQMECP